jgi:aspartate/methionine/tyrosine aminotransferase
VIDVKMSRDRNRLFSAFSARASFDLAPNRLAAARARAEGRPVLDLTESNPTRAGIPYDTGRIVAALASRSALLYEPHPFGLAAARQAVAGELSMHGPGVDASRIVLTASTSEAYAFVFKLLCDPDDEVLVPRPSYPLFDHLARLESVKAVPYRLAYDGAWHVDLPSVEEAISARTRAIVVVSPNNPTGSYVTAGELAALGRHGLPIVSDEVFRSYGLSDDAPRAPSALEGGDGTLVFALGGLSKLAALPQMKLAWIAVGGDAGRTEAALSRLEVIADAFLSVGTPVQHALPALLASRGVAERAILDRARENLAWIVAALRQSPVSPLHVEGGWYATLKLPRTRSEEAWALAFLEQDSVYVHPGHFFDFEDEAYAVVSLLTPAATLRDGIRRIAERVQRDA